MGEVHPGNPESWLGVDPPGGLWRPRLRIAAGPHERDQQAQRWRLYIGQPCQLVVELVPSPAGPQAFAARGEVELELEVEGLHALGIGAQRTRTELVGPATLELFRLELPLTEDSPQLLATLSLVVRGDAGRAIRPDWRPEIEIQGGWMPAPPEQLHACGLDPEAPLPPGLILLRALPGEPGSDQVRVHAYCEGVESALDLRVPRGPGPLTDPQRPRGWLHAALSALKRAGELRRWLLAALATSADPTVVIVDDASSDIPWELLPIDGPVRPLGARARIARWTRVEGWDAEAQLLEVQAILHQGQGMHHVAAAVGGEPERSALQALHSTAVPELSRLLDALGAAQPTPGLVYIAALGRALTWQEEDATPLHSLGFDADRIDSLGVDLFFDPGAAERAVVVANACFASWFQPRPAGLQGLAPSFLADLARAFLGPTGAVDPDLAAQLGAQLLHACTEGVEPTALLRDGLAAAARELAEQTDSQLALRRYVHHGIYAWWGPPRLMLRVAGG